MNKKTKLNYLHGFDNKEQERLHKQAEFLEYIVYSDLNLSHSKNLLEVGCGVGAQSQILLRRFPKMHLTGIDLNEKQLETAKKTLEGKTYLKDRFKIMKMDASNMDFESSSFDGAFLCWVLEHVPDPARVLSEVRRVLAPGSTIYVTEVMNHSFFLEPYSPNVWRYWQAFNDYQFEHAGDPFIGAKMGNLLMSVGFQTIHTEIKTLHLDNRNPGLRKEIFEYWAELLLSAADQLVKSKYTDQETVDKARDELQSVRNDPNSVFMYSFMQAKAKT
jgi:ubiquinone/menaquinone biosynthesis C-methylase UbiE